MIVTILNSKCFINGLEKLLKSMGPSLESAKLVLRGRGKNTSQWTMLIHPKLQNREKLIGYLELAKVIKKEWRVLDIYISVKINSLETKHQMLPSDMGSETFFYSR